MTRTDCQLIARWRTVAMTLPLLGCAACSLFVVPGDGYLGVIGSVYEPAPEGVGVVLVDAERSASAENNARPIGGCAVTLEPWSPDIRPNPAAPKRLTRHAVSDANGRFRVGGLAKPGRYDATLSIACEGFTSVTRIFRHD